MGASAGALVAALAACGVDLDAATDRAWAMAVEHDLLRRPLGLAGVWGGLIRQWLEELLPEDAAGRCGGGRLHVLTLQLLPATLRPPAGGLLPGRRCASRFSSKAELVDALMASVHLPLFLDGRPLARLGGGLHMDGSFLLEPRRTFARGLGGRGPDDTDLLVFFRHDESLKGSGPFDFVSIQGSGVGTREGLRGMQRKGYEWAARRLDEGALGLHAEPLESDRTHGMYM